MVFSKYNFILHLIWCKKVNSNFVWHVCSLKICLNTQIINMYFTLTDDSTVLCRLKSVKNKNLFCRISIKGYNIMIMFLQEFVQICVLKLIGHQMIVTWFFGTIQMLYRLYIENAILQSKTCFVKLGKNKGFDP